MRKNRIRFEAFELDLLTGELHKAGSRIPLQDKPARLLTLLANRPGELVTRDEIQRELWKDGEFVEFEHAVNTAIRKIRIALEDNTESPRIIETLPRKGYRFIAAVNVLEQPPGPITNGKDSQGKPSKPPEDGFVLPVSLNLCRLLFLLAQIPYVASYMAVFYNWDSLDAALIRTFGYFPVDWSRFSLRILALVGFTVRIYLVGLVGWGHTDAGPRYRKLFPFLLVLDGIWAATPLLVQRLTPLVSWAGLILMGWLVFGQRTLMASIEHGLKQSGQRT
jgi:DNA-binding winged helix-turn-helix (wHTH) protein